MTYIAFSFLNLGVQCEQGGSVGAEADVRVSVQMPGVTRRSLRGFKRAEAGKRQMQQAMGRKRDFRFWRSKHDRDDRVRRVERWSFTGVRQEGKREKTFYVWCIGDLKYFSSPFSIVTYDARSVRRVNRFSRPLIAQKCPLLNRFHPNAR